MTPMLKSLLNLLLPEVCSESNASSFTSFACNVRDRCWWDGSRGWTFLPTLHYILLPCDRLAAQGQSDKMASDMEVCRRQRCVTEFLHAEKMAPIDIQWHLLNVDGDQTVDVSTVRQWVECFSSGNSGSLAQVQIFMSGACRLLFTIGINELLMVVTTLKKWCFVAENLLYQMVLLWSSYLL